MQGLLIGATVPRARDGAVRIPRAGDDEACVLFALGGKARAGGQNNDVCVYSVGDAGDVSVDGALVEDLEALADLVGDGVEKGFFFTFVGAFRVVTVLGLAHLPFVEEVVAVGGDEGGHYDLFGDYGAVDAGGYGDGDGGVFVDGFDPEVVRSCADDVDKFCDHGLFMVSEKEESW